MVTTKAYLESAKAYIEKGWVQGDLAQDANGTSVEEHDPSATCWCSIGAISAATEFSAYPSNREVYIKTRDALASAIRLKYGCGIPAWNDESGRTKEEIIEMFDKAIELAED